MNDWSALMVVAILVIAAPLTIGQGVDPDIKEKQEAVREAFADFPDRIGKQWEWLEISDVRIPSSQAKMLDLNAFVSKKYQLLGESPVLQCTLFLANSIDARSMAGHHPPNCYPAIGWMSQEAAEREFRSTIYGDVEMCFMVYSFERGTSSQLMRVVNGFVLPSGMMASRLADASQLMGRAETSREGLTQYQLIFSSNVSVERAAGFAEDIFGSLPIAILESLGLRPGGHDPTEHGNE